MSDTPKRSDAPETMGCAEDDDRFIASINHLLGQIASRHRPRTVAVVRVKNWFDHKWLRFSGKGRVAIDEDPGTCDTALAAFFSEKLTFPPFTPSRIEREQLFLAHEDGGYEGVPLEHALHPSERRHSVRNLRRRVADGDDSAFYIWYSSNSRVNARGCAMVYSQLDDETGSWYCSVCASPEWKVDRCKGISKSAAGELLGLSGS